MNLYVHVPFCVSKCRYCAFHSETGASAEALVAFPRLVARELALRTPWDRGAPHPLPSLARDTPWDRGAPHPLPGTPLTTLYLGGGTPSSLGPDGLRALAAALPALADGAEFTVELNPADVDAPLAEALCAAGVTRASLGAQTFDPAALRFLGRRHAVADTLAAASALRHAGFDNVSLDLIAAVPGCGGASFRRSLEQAIALEPRHLSVYALTVEEGTPLAEDVRAGRVKMPADDETLDALAEAEAALARAGYVRYEISNYALPGFECRHNLAVWQGEDYIGLGPAAASRQGLVRRTNRPDFAVWASALDAGRPPPADEEALPPEEDERERFITGLRLAAGVRPDPATALGRTRQAVCERLERLGLLAALPGGVSETHALTHSRTPTSRGAYALTPRGREVADAVMAEFA